MILDEIKESFRENDIIIKLLYVNAAVFLIVRLLDICALVSPLEQGWALAWLAMPIGGGLLYRPWTLLTNIFLHYDLVHFIFNMFSLYWFGRIFMGIYGSERRALKVYVIGGVAGSILAMLTALSGRGGILLGASGAIMALLLSATYEMPGRRIWVTFFGEVQLKYIAIVYIMLDILMIIGLSNVGGHLAHIGGAVAGLALSYKWRGTTEGDETRGHASLRELLTGKRQRKLKVSRGSGNVDWEYNKRRNDANDELDRILEKVHAHGYNSLTDAEKKALFDMSKR